MFCQYLFGEQTREGVLVFSNTIFLHCGKPPQTYYVMDENSVSYDYITHMSGPLINRCVTLDDIKGKDGNFIRLVVCNIK
jgi:hypothetical protein